MKPIQLDEPDHKRLKILAAKLGKTVRDLATEALELLFKKYEGKEDEL
jgi:hypothetical protein